MYYHVVFDVAQQPYAWWWPALGLIFVVFARIGWQPVVFGSKISFSTRTWMTIGIIWITITGVITGLAYYSTQEVMRQKAYLVVAGKVENFIPAPYEGHAEEQFTVTGVRFAYSDYDSAAGYFHTTSSHGGPIRAGLDVRIAYLPNLQKPGQNDILRLEIKE